MRKQNLAIKGKQLKTGEAAQRLHVSPQTLRDWTDNNLIPAVISDGGHRTYFEAEVDKKALELKGVTSYWQVSMQVALNSQGSTHYSNPNFDAEDKTKLSVVEIDFNKYWNYTNGLEVEPHLVVLNSKPKVVPLENLEQAYQFYLDEDNTQPLVAVVVTVVGLDKEECVKKMSQAAMLGSAWLQENFTPKQTIVWETFNGEPVD